MTQTTKTSLLQRIEADIKAAEHAIANAFSSFIHSNAMKQFETAALGMLKSDLGQIVLAEVESLAGVTDMSGAQKAASAQQAVLNKAKNLGISTSKSLVNLLIETAVQYVTGNLGSVAAQVQRAQPSSPNPAPPVTGA